MQLRSRHVVITGASRGIGRAVAVQAAQRGARVTVVARSAAALQEVAAHTAGHSLPLDLATSAQRQELLSRAEQLGGPVDVLVNVAGAHAVGSSLQLSSAELEHLFQVNLLAPAELCRQVLPGMVERGGGHVVNVSSGFSTMVSQGLTAYSASKAGLSHLTAGLRAELVGTGIGTTLVELGPVNTSMYAAIQQDRLAGPALERTVRLRAAPPVEPEDVARHICDAIERGRQHVVLPLRMTPLLALSWIPRRASQVFLGGLRRR